MGAGDDGLPLPGQPVAQAPQTAAPAAPLAQRWRVQGRSEGGLYTGSLVLTPQADGRYAFTRTVPGQQVERGEAWLERGRLRIEQVLPVSGSGLLQGLQSPLAEDESRRPRRGVYLRLGESFQGVSRQEGGPACLERLDPLVDGHDNAVDLLIDGGEFFPLLRSHLAAAQHTIAVQSFILTDDSTGRSIAEILKERARAGVAVRVLIDGSGDRMTRDYKADLRAGGVELIVQHKYLTGFGNSLKRIPGKIFGFFKRLFGGSRPEPQERRGLFNHDHRKITVVDGQVAFIGGMNLAREYEFEWHDVHTRVRGSAVRELEELFYDRWRAAGGQAETPPAQPPIGDGGLAVEVLAALPGISIEIKERYLREIRNAEHRVLIEMAYFLDTDIINALKDAEARGVRTLVIVPSDEKHDVKIVRDAFNHVQNDFVRAGIELYKFRRDQNLHTKVASFDGRLATVGSSNLDAMALTKLAEANIFVPDRAFTAEVDQRIFARDVPLSERVKVQKFSWWEKLKGFTLNLVRGVL